MGAVNNNLGGCLNLLSVRCGQHEHQRDIACADLCSGQYETIWKVFRDAGFSYNNSVFFITELRYSY